MSAATRERYLSSLSSLVTGGLIVDTSNGADLPPDRALCRVAGALLKAVLLATHHSGGSAQLGPEGWDSSSDELTDAEQYEAMSGIVSMLRDGSKVLAELSLTGEFRPTWERIEHIEANEDQAQRLESELALERQGANDGEAGES